MASIDYVESSISRRQTGIFLDLQGITFGCMEEWQGRTRCVRKTESRKRIGQMFCALAAFMLDLWEIYVLYDAACRGTATPAP